MSPHAADQRIDQRIDHGRDAAINAAAARTVDRADAVVALLLRLLGVLAVVLLGVWALLSYMEPCATGSLCMAAVMTPTRLTLRQRLREWLRLLRNQARYWYIERRIAGVEFDLQVLAKEAAAAPYREEYARRLLSELRVQLIELDLHRIRSMP